MAGRPLVLIADLITDWLQKVIMANNEYLEDPPPPLGPFNSAAQITVEIKFSWSNDISSDAAPPRCSSTI